MHQKKEVMILLMKKNILNLIFSPTKIQYYRQTMQLIFLYNVSVEKYSKFHLLTPKTGQQKRQTQQPMYLLQLPLTPKPGSIVP